jgi:hypothetical protein
VKQLGIETSLPGRCFFSPGCQSTVVNASANNAFCSTSCAFAEPVAGLALAERFTEITGRSFAMYRKRGSM